MALRLGVATAGYQVEGGFNGPDQPHNNWLWWEKSGRAERSGEACAFWARPEVALDRAAALGCDAFALSVEWARLQPGDGGFDDRAVEGYRRILDACAERGLQPTVTLSHFTHPARLGEEFWLTPGSPDRFAAYAGAAVALLADRCRRWVTVFEPGTLAVAGWVTGRFPPGRHLAVADALAVLDNLLTAHLLAERAIRAVQPGAVVASGEGWAADATLYEVGCLGTDLLYRPGGEAGAGGVDEWVDARRRAHDDAVPPVAPVERWRRRLAAALSAYGTDGRGTPAPVRRRLRRPAPRRVLRLEPLVPGEGAALASSGAGAGRRWSAQASLHPALAVWAFDGGADPAPALAARSRGAAVGTYFHQHLVDGYRWGSYRPGSGLFGVTRPAGSAPVRWLERAWDGSDAAAAFRERLAAARAEAPATPPRVEPGERSAPER